MSSKHENIVVAATCCLHNFLINNSAYGPQDELEDEMNALINLPLIRENAIQLALDTRKIYVQRGFHHI